MVAYFHGMEGVESSNLFRSTSLRKVLVGVHPCLATLAGELPHFVQSVPSGPQFYTLRLLSAGSFKSVYKPTIFVHELNF